MSYGVPTFLLDPYFMTLFRGLLVFEYELNYDDIALELSSPNFDLVYWISLSESIAKELFVLYSDFLLLIPRIKCFSFWESISLFLVPELSLEKFLLLALSGELDWLSTISFKKDDLLATLWV